MAVLLLVIFALQACTPTESESLLPDLTHVESIMHQHPDSAYHYFNKYLTTDNIYAKYAAYEALYNLSLKEKNYAKAVEYGGYIKIYADSIQTIGRSQTLIEMQEKYDEEKVINEKNLLKIEKDRTIRNLLLILIVALIFIGALIFVYQHKLISKQRVICSHEETEKEYGLQMHENELKMMQNESRIIELTAEMERGREMKELLEDQRISIEKYREENEALNKENVQLLESLSQYSIALSEKIKELDVLSLLSEENATLRKREKYLCNQLLKQNKLLGKLKMKPGTLNAAQWDELYDILNWVYNNFIDRLNHQIPSLTDADMQICCLVKLRFQVPDIASILGISLNSVSKRKLRLKERIIQESGTTFEENLTLDLWLWEY